jgi:hypothetical protein
MLGKGGDYPVSTLCVPVPGALFHHAVKVLFHFLYGLLLLCGVHSVTHAQQPEKTSPPSSGVAPLTGKPRVEVELPQVLIARFFGLLQKGDIEQAYDQLTRGTRIAGRPDDLKTLKTKTVEAVKLFGAIRGYELIEVKNRGERLTRMTYFSLGADFPLRWRFYFYRPDNDWLLIDIRVDDRLISMFEDEREAGPLGP